ncbi:hypothetical protein QN277_011073 [Acacia crassicarpa]|uniref:Mediator complex subunit 15 KIX domain-containing protein n=1 Tax=Acacia crassicarpa TaxID=499986 RepID=A0AAE1JK66_9FABA|nr:hypothetical protein QN277_011073 [Acacia crassicarpa]
MGTHDWRAQLPPQTRQIKVDEITYKLNYYQSHGGGDDELVEVQKIARCYEQKTYAGAASQEDYLQKISSMILSLSEKWRSLLQPAIRQRIINKVVETLRRHFPYSGQEVDEVRKIATRFEEKIYRAAVSKSDYLRKISLKMLTLEAKGQNTGELCHQTLATMGGSLVHVTPQFSKAK